MFTFVGVTAMEVACMQRCMVCARKEWDNMDKDFNIMMKQVLQTMNAIALGEKTQQLANGGIHHVASNVAWHGTRGECNKEEMLCGGGFHAIIQTVDKLVVATGQIYQRRSASHVQILGVSIAGVACIPGSGNGYGTQQASVA